jgi:hypothetical protein
MWRYKGDFKMSRPLNEMMQDGKTWVGGLKLWAIHMSRILSPKVGSGVLLRVKMFFECGIDASKDCPSMTKHQRWPPSPMNP